MSLKAIATALGVSVTTVSRALGGYADVSASTRARVEAEARRRGYRPNTQARRLKTGKTDAVGLVFLWIWSVASAGNLLTMILTYY